MKQSKKYIALLLSFVLVLSSMTITEAATTNTAKAKVLHDLGLFNGVSATEYVPDLESATDAAQAIVLIGRALQWPVDQNATVTFTDVPTWAIPYVDYAVKANITNGISTTEFGTDIINGQRIVAWFLRALGYDMQDSWNNTALLATQANLSVPTGSLRDDVIGVIYQALTTIPVGGSATLIQTIVGSDPTKLAIALNAGLVPDEYAILSIKMVGAKSVEIKFNRPVDEAEEIIIETTSKNPEIYYPSDFWNDARDTVTLTTSDDLPARSYRVEVRIDAHYLSERFDVSAPTVSSFEITSSLVDDETPDAQIHFIVKNQYGEDMSVISTNQFAVTAYNTTQKSDVTVVTNTNARYFEIDTFALTDAFKSGDSILVIVTYRGITMKKYLTVRIDGAFDNISFGDIVLVDTNDTSLDESDATVKLNYTLVENYGAVVDLNSTPLVAIMPTTIQGIQFVSSNNNIISGIKITDNSEGYGEIYLTVAGAGEATITAIIAASGSIASKKITVLATASPKSVSFGMPSTVVAGGDAPFDLPLVINDQYGNALSTSNGVTFSYEFSASNSTVILTKADADGTPKLTVDLSSVIVSSGDGTSTLKINAKNALNEVIGTINLNVEPNAMATAITSTNFSKVFEFNGIDGATLTLTNAMIVVKDQYGRDITGNISLVSSNPGIITVTGKTLEAKAVGSSTLTITVGSATTTTTVSVINSSSISSYSMPTISKLYAVSPVNALYQKNITIQGVDSSNKAVVLVNDVPDFVTSSDISKVTASGTLLTGVDAGTSVISAWIDTKKVATQTVTVSKEVPYAVTIEYDVLEIINGGDLTTLLKVIDQYGIDVVGSVFFAVNNANYTITNGKNINGPTGYVDITAITSNGLSVTKSIKVN